MGRCYRCKQETQPLPGPTEDGERTYRVMHAAHLPGFRYEDPEGELLICARCMLEQVRRATEERADA